ncbi:hypothetical protein Tcan_09522 [Toxocara canis]|uniref:Uncharacterized protein n=1 Tax=Toxocara canis TaxID=6265 RepID=A0A0B2VTA3_TOXCA|nr:hypothetical protein Tcan_09522 [Toxocara canis]
MSVASVYILLSFSVIFVCTEPRFATIGHHYEFDDTLQRARRGEMRSFDKGLFMDEDMKLEPSFSPIDVLHSPVVVRQSRNQLHQLNRLLKKPVFNFANLFRRTY